MDHHMALFKLLTLFSIVANVVWSLENENIIGDNKKVLQNPTAKHGYHATLYNKEFFDYDLCTTTCGASFVTHQHLVTAAHCIKGRTWNIRIYVVLGNQNIDFKKVQSYHEVVEAYVPLRWDSSQTIMDSFRYDIGVVKLEYALMGSEYSFIKPLKLPESNWKLGAACGEIIGAGNNELKLCETGLEKEGGCCDNQLRITRYCFADDIVSCQEPFTYLECNQPFKLCGVKEDDEYKEPFGILSEGDSGGGVVKEGYLIGVYVATENNVVLTIPNLCYFANMAYHRGMIDHMTGTELGNYEIDMNIYKEVSS